MIRPKLDLVGRRFGRLVVGEKWEARGRKGKTNVFWLCTCDCSAEQWVRASDLTSGNTTSCGCFHREASSLANTKHGKWGTSEYHAWQNMIQRCDNPNDKDYPDYGGRGITYCDRWKVFENFYEDMGPKLSPELSIHRPNDCKYGPGCKWATPTEQNRNKRNNRIVSLGGKEMCFAEACEIVGLHRSTVRNRMNRRNLTFEEAIAVPVRVKKPISAERTVKVKVTCGRQISKHEFQFEFEFSLN